MTHKLSCLHQAVQNKFTDSTPPTPLMHPKRAHGEGTISDEELREALKRTSARGKLLPAERTARHWHFGPWPT